MTTNTTFRRAADRIRKSAFVLPMFVVYAVLLAISIIVMREDVWTSWKGYLALPTESGFAITALAIAFLPSIGQLATGYVTIALANNENDRTYAFVSGLIWGLLFLVDAYTDIFYRNGFGWNVDLEVWLTAIIQTVGVFTLGSELFFVLGFGMVMELFPDAFAESLGLIIRIKTTWNERFGSTPPQNQQPKQKPQNQPNQQRPQNHPHVPQR